MDRDSQLNKDPNTPPRLLMLVTSTQRRGGELFGQQIAAGLAERGWDARIKALVRSDGPSIDAEPLVDKPREALRAIDQQVIRALRHEIVNFKPDVIFANGGATLPVSVGARAFNGPGSLVYGSIGEPLYWAKTRLARRRTGFLMRRCDLITSISRPTRRQLVEVFGVPSERVVVIHPGVDEAFFMIESEAPRAELRVLFLGSVSREKGPLTALAAFERAATAAPMVMRFVGGGPVMPELSAAVAARQLEQIVDVVGPVNNVHPHLAWADVLVLASQSEGLPGVVLEAAAAGVPTVTFDVGGVSDVVTSGETGMLIAKADVDSMSDALLQLANDGEMRRRLGEGARDRVRDEFDLKASLDRYDDILRALIKGRPVSTGEN